MMNESKMKAYKVMIDGRSFMTVGGKNEAEARESTKRQLDRTGRRGGYFIRWRDAGSVVVEKRDNRRWVTTQEWDITLDTTGGELWIMTTGDDGCGEWARLNYDQVQDLKRVIAKLEVELWPQAVAMKAATS